MRAVEEGVPVMRVANNGISAGFDSYGRILGQIALDTVGTIDLSVPLPSRQQYLPDTQMLGFLAC